MQSLKERFRGTTERLRNLGTPDGVERQVMDVVERATSEMLINPDWGLNMELVDTINTDATTACYERVFRSLRRRLLRPNPKIQILTLTLLETCVKNTGSEFQTALAESDFWEEVVRLADPKRKADLQVQDKVLVLIEDCAHALPSRGYKSAYDALKKSGLRFPVRQAEEIGAGFNLPPSSRDATAMADVSAEDQAVIQQVLRDWGQETTAPSPPPAREYQPPAMDTTQGDAQKLHADLRVVANTVELLKDALGSIPLNEPDMVYQDYIKDLSGQCTEMLPKLKKLIEGATNEGVLAEALGLNDELGATLGRYDAMIKSAQEAKNPAVPEEPSLMAFEDVPVSKGGGTATVGSSSQPPPPGDSFAALASGSAPPPVVPADPFDVLAAQNAPPPGVQPPPPPVPPQPERSGQQKEKDPFEDLISL